MNSVMQSFRFITCGRPESSANTLAAKIACSGVKAIELIQPPPPSSNPSAIASRVSSIDAETIAGRIRRADR